MYTLRYVFLAFEIMMIHHNFVKLVINLNMEVERTLTTIHYFYLLFEN
jgi:hypothetical protein